VVRNKLLRSKKPGSVIALVLFAVVLLVLSGVGVLSLGQTARVFSIRTAAEVAARTAADAGITKAIWQMNANLKDGWSKHTLPYENNTEPPNCGATYSYIVAKASDIAASGDGDLIDFVGRAYPTTAPGAGDYVVRSIGRYHEAERVIYATVRLVGCGDTGVLVRDSMVLKAGTLVDGRDSSDPTNLDVLVEIGTISTAPGAIVLNNGVTVDGNILVGVGGVPTTVIKDLGATVTGDKYPMTEEPEFPYIYPPALPDNHTKKIEIGPKEDPNLYIDESWNGIYSMIDLDQNNRTERLIIKSGNNVVLCLTNTGNKRSISLGVNCEIIIENGATLNLYVAGNIVSNTGSGFNNLGTPPQLKLWGNWTESTPTTGYCQDWQLNAKSEYFGQIYAPAATLQVNNQGNSGELWGAFTAYNLTMMNSGKLYYDGALRDVDPDDPGVRFVLKRWQE